jgi:hypothetical protein
MRPSRAKVLRNSGVRCLSGSVRLVKHFTPQLNDPGVAGII